MTISASKKYLPLLALIFSAMALTLFNGCTPASEVSACTPTVNGYGNKINFEITYTGSTVFQFKVCENENEDFQGASFYVFGGTDYTDLDLIDPSKGTSEPRLRGGTYFSNASNPGDVFEVTFNDSDRYFLIFKAEEDNNFSYTNEIFVIRGSLYE